MHDQPVQVCALFQLQGCVELSNPRAGSTKNTPGPGQYSPREQLNPAGSYFLSKYHSFGTRTFYHYDRDTLKLPESARSKLPSLRRRLLTDIFFAFAADCLVTPGPGSYRLPSDFGFYESRQKYGEDYSSVPATARMHRSTGLPQENGRMSRSGSQPGIQARQQEL